MYICFSMGVCICILTSCKFKWRERAPRDSPMNLIWLGVQLGRRKRPDWSIFIGFGTWGIRSHNANRAEAFLDVRRGPPRNPPGGTSKTEAWRGLGRGSSRWNGEDAWPSSSDRGESEMLEQHLVCLGQCTSSASQPAVATRKAPGSKLASQRSWHRGERSTCH